MKIKCPGCQLLLQVPDTAAGKIVKCKCGKQLRAPGASPTPAAGQPNAAARPAVTAASPKPVAPRPVAPKPGTPAPFDAGLLDELTDLDLQPVKAVGLPGKVEAKGKGTLSSYEKEAAEGSNNYKAGAAKEVYSSIGLLLFLGLLRVGLYTYFLINVEKEVEELGLDPSLEGEGEMDSLLRIVKIFYIMGISIGAVFLACAALIFKFPLTCSIVALVTFVISEIIGLMLNPFRLFSIGGWIGRAAIFGGLVQTVNNASYYKFVKSGGRG